MSRTHAPRRPASASAGIVCAVIVAVSALVPPCAAQTAASTAPGLTDATRAKLDRRVSLTLPGVPLREALMSVREVAGLNLVINQELTGTVDMAFRDAPVHEVLDTLLLSRGLGYRPVGDGLVIVPIADLGAGNPLLESEVFATPSVDPAQLLPIVQEMLSPEGRAHAMPAGRALIAFDYPARLAAIRTQVNLLDAAAANRTASDRVDAARSGGAPTGRPGQPGGPFGGPVESMVLELLYVPPTAMAATLTPLLGPNGRISAMDNEGRLLIVDAPANLKTIRAAMRDLDVPRLQVRIRALIYDCALEDSHELGLNWDGGVKSRGFAADGSPLQSLAFNGVTAAGAVNPTAAGGLAIAKTASDYLDLGATLRALDQSKDSRLLADPNVVVLNHEQADIKIVTEVPYQELTQSALGGAIGTTSFREAGVTLAVTPHIAPDHTVTMLVHPEFSVLSGFTPDSNAPIIDTREATTTVRIADRETLVLGGLRQRSKVRTVNSLPFFGTLPVCGRLFRYQSFDVRESELVVFLTPEIVHVGYSGDCRETGIAVFGKSELDASPVYPAPMGLAAAVDEDPGCLDIPFDGRSHRGPWASPLGRTCDLPEGTFAAPIVTGLIAPEFAPAPIAETRPLPPAPASSPYPRASFPGEAPAGPPAAAPAPRASLPAPQTSRPAPRTPLPAPIAAPAPPPAFPEAFAPPEPTDAPMPIPAPF